MGVYEMYESTGTNGVWWALYFLAVLALAIASIVGMWKMFEKADEPGWKSIIPFYNIYTYFRITGRNGWSVLLLFIPFVNIFV